MKLSIDPSINDLGWATFNGSWHYGTISPKGETLPARLEFISYALKAVCSDPSELIVEYPQFEQSARGSIAAVKGYTFGLAAIAGFLQGHFSLRSNRVFHYTPAEWKGQIPIQGIKYRFAHKFGHEPKTEHEAHAAMLLDFHINKLDK